jgi:arylsulfatase A
MTCGPSLIEDDKVVKSPVTGEDQKLITTWYTGRAVEFIDKNKDKPFFLYVPHSMPHVPLYVSGKFKGSSKQGLYGDVIQEIDWSVGEILKAIKRNGLDENTLVIFTSDNGPWISYGDHAGSALPLREAKGTAWEGGQREPTIMRWPGSIPAGTVCDTPAMSIDLLPTIAHLIDAVLPKHTIDGLNIWPLIAGEKGAKNPHEGYWFYYKQNELHAVLMGKWKLYFPHTYRTLGNRAGGTGGTPVRYHSAKVTKPELYNLADDIGETRDLAAKYPEVVKRLERFAEKARAELGDRLTKRQGKGVRAPGQVAKK